MQSVPDMGLWDIESILRSGSPLVASGGTIEARYSNTPNVSKQ